MTEGFYTKANFWVASLAMAFGSATTYVVAAAENSWWPFNSTSSTPAYPEQQPIESDVVARVVVRTGSDCQDSADQGRCWVGVWPTPVQNVPPQVTRVKHGTQLGVICYRTNGETISNGSTNSDGQPVPGRSYSDLWFWVKTQDGKTGYIPKVWVVSQVGPVDRACTFKSPPA